MFKGKKFMKSEFEYTKKKVLFIFEEEEIDKTKPKEIGDDLDLDNN
jgi:hypothetical protein